MDQHKTSMSITEDMSMVAQDGLRNFLDNMSINSMPTPLAASTVARDKDRLKQLAKTDPMGSFLGYGMPDTHLPFDQAEQMGLSFSNLNESQQKEVAKQAEDLVKNIQDKSQTLTEFDSSSTLGILEVEAMTDSDLLFDKQTDGQPQSSLGSSDCQAMGRSHEVNTVKKRPGVDKEPTGADGARAGVNLFGANFPNVHEETEFDQSTVNIQFDDGDLDLLDQDFSDLVDFDNEHGQGEGQESEEETGVPAFQSQTHGAGLDLKYFLPSHNTHFVGDGEDNQVKHSRRDGIGQQKATTDMRQQQSQLSELREQFCNGDGSEIDTDDELEAARTTLLLEQGERLSNGSMGQQSPRPGLEGEPEQPEANRFSMMLRQSAEGEIVSSPVPGDGGGGGDGSSGSESDDGQKTTTSSVTSQSVPHKFAPGMVYPPTYRPDSFPEEERIRPMGDDLLTEADPRSFSSAVYTKEQANFGTSSLQEADNNKLLESWYLKPSGENFDSPSQQGGLTDSMFQNTGVSDSILTGHEQTANDHGGGDSHEMEGPLDVMQSSLGLFGIPQTKSSADSPEDVTFTSNAASNIFDTSIGYKNLALKTSLSGEASKQMDMFKMGEEDSLLPSEDNFFDPDAANAMLNADEEEFIHENIFRMDGQMEPDRYSYQSIVTNSQSSWDEYNPLLNASMSQYWAARTENLGTLDGNSSCPRPAFGMVIRSPNRKSQETLYRTSGVGDEDGSVDNDNTLIVEDLLKTPTSVEEAVAKPTGDVAAVKQSQLPEEIAQQSPDYSFADKTNCIDSSAVMSFLRKPPTDGSPGTYINTLMQIVKSKSSNTSKSRSANSRQNINKASNESKVSCLPVKKGSNVEKKQRQRTPVALKRTTSEPSPEHLRKTTNSPAERDTDIPMSERGKSTISQTAKNDKDKTNHHHDDHKLLKEKTDTSPQNGGRLKDCQNNVNVSFQDVSSTNAEPVARDYGSPHESNAADQWIEKQTDDVDSEWESNSKDLPSKETSSDRTSHRTDTGYWSGIDGHHEPDGTEYSPTSNYLSTDKKLSRDNVVGTSDIKMAESRGYRVVSVERSNSPSCDSTLLGSMVSVNSTMTSNQNTLCSSHSQIPANTLDDGDSYFRSCATTGFTTPSVTPSSTSSYQAQTGMLSNTDRDWMSNFTDKPMSGMQTGGQTVRESSRTMSSRDFVSNSSSMQPSVAAFSGRGHEMDFPRMPPSSGMVIDNQSVPRLMTNYVSNPSMMEVTNYVPDVLTFEPLRESLSCSRWTPEMPSQISEHISDSENQSRVGSMPGCLAGHSVPTEEDSRYFGIQGYDSAMQTFRDIDEDHSRFNPGLYSTPFLSQTSCSITYVTPSHARSLLSTMPADGGASNAVDATISATPCKMSLLQAPSLLSFSSFCCAGTSITRELPLKNPTLHYLKCVIHVDSLVVNGRDVDPQAHTPFDFKRMIIVKPKSEELLEVMFLPSIAGTYLANVTIFTNSFLVDVQSSVMCVPIKFTIQAIAEAPRIQLITSEEGCISFGELTWGLCIGSQFGVVNIGKSEVPLRLVISSVNSAWHCFTFDNGSTSRDLSIVSNNSRPLSPALSRTVFNLTLPGCDDQVKKNVEHIQIYCRTPAKSIDRALAMNPPERLLARLDIELDIPVHRVKPIASIMLRATVGVVKLKTSPACQNIVMKCQFEKEASESIRLMNVGNIAMGVEVFVSSHEDVFTIDPPSLSIPEHSNSTVSITFSPNTQNVSTYKTLLTMVIEPEAQAYALGLVGELQIPQEPAASVLQGNKTALTFGGVAIGQAKQLKTIIQNAGLSPVVINVAIKSDTSCFQLQEVLSSTGEARNTDRIVMKPKERLTMHVLFNPLSQQYCSGKLVFRHSGSKFCVGLSGYGGTSCIALEGAASMGSQLFQINVGTLSRGLNSSTKVILKNTGSKAAYVKAVVCSDRHGCSILNLGNVAVDPNEFVVASNNCKVISIVMSPSDRELALCRENKEVIGYVIFYWGDEILRQNYRKAVNSKQSSKIKFKNSTFQQIKFGVVYMGEHPQTEETSHTTNKEDIDVFYLSMHQTCLAIVAEPPIHEDLSVTAPRQSSFGIELDQKQLSGRLLSNTAPSLEISKKWNSQHQTSTSQPCASTSSQVNVQENQTSDWEIQPRQIILTVLPSSTEVVRSKKFQILNYANRNLQYELQWPGHMVIVDPTHGIVNPKSSISVSVVPATNAHKYLNQMLWNGTIRVEVNNISKSLQVQVKMDIPLDLPSTDGSLNNLTSQLSSTQPAFNPSSLNEVIQMASLEVRFLQTKVGSQSEDILQFSNISGCSVMWMLSSFAPPYVKHVGNKKDVFRVEYSVFQFVKKSGQLKPNETATISVWFQPQSKGLYTQYWDIICKMKSATGKTSATTRVHLVGEGQDGEQQASTSSLPRGVMLEHPVSEKTSTTKAVSETKDLEKRPERSVYLTSSSLTFPPSAVGKCVSKKIQIGNDSVEQREVKVICPRPPFYIRHMTFQIKGNKFLNFPIEFKAKEKGVFKSRITFETDQGKIYLNLHGECV